MERPILSLASFVAMAKMAGYIVVVSFGDEKIHSFEEGEKLLKEDEARYMAAMAAPEMKDDDCDYLSPIYIATTSEKLEAFGKPGIDGKDLAVHGLLNPNFYGSPWFLSSASESFTVAIDRVC